MYGYGSTHLWGKPTASTIVRLATVERSAYTTCILTQWISSQGDWDIRCIRFKASSTVVLVQPYPMCLKFMKCRALHLSWHLPSRRKAELATMDSYAHEIFREARISRIIKIAQCKHWLTTGHLLIYIIAIVQSPLRRIKRLHDDWCVASALGLVMSDLAAMRSCRAFMLVMILNCMAVKLITAAMRSSCLFSYAFFVVQAEIIIANLECDSKHSYFCYPVGGLNFASGKRGH